MATARSRRWVNRLLSALETYPIALDAVSPLVSEARNLDKEAVPALVEAMQSEDGGKALAAAWLLVVLVDEEGFSVNEASLMQARQALMETLESGPDDLKLLACYFLMMGGGTVALLPGLKSLLTHKNYEIVCLAASAVSRFEPNDVATGDALRLALSNDNDVLAGLAAAALLRIDSANNEAIDCVCCRLAELGDVGGYVVVSTIKHVAPKSERILDAVAKVAVDDHVHPAVRQNAAEAVGILGKGRKTTETVLLKVLESSDARVVDGAIEGFLASGHVPSKALQRLSLLLSDQEQTMRMTVAAGLKAMKARALPALPAMAGCFSEEQNIEVAYAISQAMAATGTPAIPVLIDLIRRHDVRTTEPAMRALASLGDAAADAIVKMYPELTDATTQKLLLTSLASMGPQTDSAISLLARLLDETDDDDLAMYIAMGLYVTGHRAKGALEALVRCLVENRPLHVRIWAERALIEVGSDAIPALEAAMKSADSGHKDRMAHVIAQIASTDELRFSRFRRIEFEDLEKFVLVADVMERLAATTFSEIERILEPDRNSGKIGFAVGHRTLLNAVEAAEGHLGKLVDRRQGRKAVLTENARKVLPEIRAFLSARRQRIALAFGS